MMAYPVIDMKETGRRLKRACEDRNLTVKDLIRFLGLSAPQSVYNWFQGRALPTLDNLYALSCYLGEEMEALLVVENGFDLPPARRDAQALLRRQAAYYGFCLEAEYRLGLMPTGGSAAIQPRTLHRLQSP